MISFLWVSSSHLEGTVRHDRPDRSLCVASTLFQRDSTRYYFQLEVISREVPMRSRTEEPERFGQMTAAAGRNRDASRAAVEILRAGSRVSRVIDAALSKAGLTLPQFNILMELASTSEASLPLYEVNARLISSPPNTSWLTKRMERAGLITKTRAHHDARVVELALTDDGWAALERAMPLVFSAEIDLLSDYTRDDLRDIARLLSRLTAPPDTLQL
jgi:DNA-binding MarR family transcriptional regulator